MANQLIWWPSPAKLNLFLHITGRRQDGYHHLQSLFQLLDQGDQLAFETTTNGAIQLMTPLPGVADEDNLIVKAANLLKQYCHVSQGANIWLDKRLPMGGGIGGGSSNAATTLVVLNTLWQCGLTLEQLEALGLQLGADVPVFVHGRTTFASGVGEQFVDTEQPKHWFLVASPGVHIATAEIFRHAELPRNTPTMQWQDYHFDSTANDCQTLVCQYHPKVAKLLHWLLEYAPSRMTGTGSCVFAVFPDQSQAVKVLQAMPAEFAGFVAQGVNISPLHSQLEQWKNG
ncbi:4-(cytidine 5'-diphospho)-2-C-methyl-D-erythritol kinase [Bowmanella denitrificans]|uniref:4-diphosphocytidyl-2-C-methyl-D-erythritol kinase n=1 Tax=Bowmanella denitrificans TaxID=366582 RepID=A0ABN0X660_9ALTE